MAAAHAADVPVDPLGRTIRDRILFETEDGDWAVTIEELRAAHEGFFPTLMGDDRAGYSAANRDETRSTCKETSCPD